MPQAGLHHRADQGKTQSIGLRKLRSALLDGTVLDAAFRRFKCTVYKKKEPIGPG
jgi:hypothetical protein